MRAIDYERTAALVGPNDCKRESVAYEAREGGFAYGAGDVHSVRRIG